MSVPILMITHNRLEYTKKALASLLQADNVQVHIFDNASTDGTQKYLQSLPDKITMWFSTENHGIATAMNVFLKETKGVPVVGKVDNDTIIPKDFIEKMYPSLTFTDIVQAKHHIIPATNPKGWAGFTENMKKKHGLYFHHYVGGSGVLFRRDLVNLIPVTENKIMGWREFQKQHPNLKKAFNPDVEIQLLDEHGYGDYPEYYKETGRI